MCVDRATQASEEARCLQSPFGLHNRFSTRLKRESGNQRLTRVPGLPSLSMVADHFSWTWSGLFGHPRPLLVEPHQRPLLTPLPCLCFLAGCPSSGNWETHT
jgi:hypothetical protein